MPRRKSVIREQELATNLRRSPRFLRKSPSVPEDPSTHVGKSSRTGRITSPHTPSSSTPNILIKKKYSEEGSGNVNESNTRSRKRPITDSRRSLRSIGRIEEFSYVELSPEVKEEKRVTRSSSRGNANSNVKEEKRVTRSSSRGNANSNVKEETRVTQCSSRENSLIKKKYSEEGSGNVNESNTRSRKRPIIGSRRSARLIGLIEECSYVELSPEVKENRVRPSLSRGNANSKVEGETRVTQCSSRENIDEGQKEVGVKRKKNHAKKDHGRIAQGWTKDQELALERAYFAAKPTPQFWKKVARLVPGKSAQNCFDKVHSNHMTPPQPQPRSRIKAQNSSPLSISASKLLSSLGPKVKRSRKSHLVQKTVRHMVRKQCQVDQDSEADLFSVLEYRTSPSPQAMQHDLVVSTPVCNQEKPELFKRCQERSSSANIKSLSRFCGSSGTTLASPPVLKQVKNKALHERYIDLLHCREAKRKAAFARNAKSHQGNGVRKDSHVQKKNAITDAKNALVFDATDAIKEFQHLQANAMMSSLSDDDDGTINNEDEGEDVF